MSQIEPERAATLGVGGSPFLSAQFALLGLLAPAPPLDPIDIGTSERAPLLGAPVPISGAAGYQGAAGGPPAHAGGDGPIAGTARHQGAAGGPAAPSGGSGSVPGSTGRQGSAGSPPAHSGGDGPVAGSTHGPQRVGVGQQPRRGTRIPAK